MEKEKVSVYWYKDQDIRYIYLLNLDKTTKKTKYYSELINGDRTGVNLTEQELLVKLAELKDIKVETLSTKI